MSRLRWPLAVGALALLVPVPAAAAPPDNAACGAKSTFANQLAEQPWPLKRLKPSNAWPLSRGQGVIVAVIDSGVSTDHPKLRNQVLPGLDTLVAGGNGQCDEFGHGTLVAGIIAGADSRDGPFSGIAPDAKILPVRVLRDNNQSRDEGTPKRIADAITWAVKNGASVINLSLTTKKTPEMDAAIAYARASDVVLVAAAGNEGTSGAPGDPIYPAGYDGVIAVAGIDADGKHVASSLVGPYVKVAAPGANIEGPAIHGNGYIQAPEGGTSFAAPYVAGTAALLRSYDRTLKADQIADRIMRTADHPPAGRDDNVGYGMVNPYRALTALLAAGTPTEQPGQVVLPAEADDPLYATKRAGPWLAVGCLVLTLLVAVLAYAVPRGSRRGWRPTRAVRAADAEEDREDFVPVVGRQMSVTAPSVRRDAPPGPPARR